MSRVTTNDDALPFVAQPSSLNYNMGKDIDWDETNSATTLPAGTIMCELASGKVCPRLTRPGSETAIGFLLASADSADRSGRAGHGMIIGGVLFENLMPDYADADWATMVAELPGHYDWLTYADDRT